MIKESFELKLPIKIRDHKDNVMIIYIAYTAEGLEFRYLEMSVTYPEEQNIQGWLEAVTKKRLRFFPKNIDYIYEECIRDPENAINIFYQYFSVIRAR